jgi:hypothetical protein
VNPTPEKLQTFEDAFSTHSGSCYATCACGRIFYNSNGGWDWEEGELENLEKIQTAVDLDYAVESLSFEGKTYVKDCKCWHDRAAIIKKFVDGHAREIANYLTAEKKRKTTVAEKAPVVK